VTTNIQTQYLHHCCVIYTSCFTCNVFLLLCKCEIWIDIIVDNVLQIVLWIQGCDDDSWWVV